jgi:hypothetical protein
MTRTSESMRATPSATPSATPTPAPSETVTIAIGPNVDGHEKQAVAAQNINQASAETASELATRDTDSRNDPFLED